MTNSMKNHAEWIPVFRTGTHTDSNGNEKTWTDAELDAIASKYQPGEHEAPAVIGHPKDNSPAWGWVEGLKRDGNILYAKFKDLVPEFVDMVRKGLFKKRSISLYPDMTLRHVGFLGAMPPAVKGLPDAAFQDGDGQIIEFAFDGNPPPVPPPAGDNCCHPLDGIGGRNNLNNFYQKEAKGMKWFDWMKKKAQDEGVTLEDAPAFSEPGRGTAPAPSPADIAAQINAEVARQVKTRELEFAEVKKQEDEKLRSREAALREKETAMKKAEIASFCEGLCKEGKLTPAMMKHGMGMVSFLEAVSGVKTPVEFSDGDTKKTQTPFEFMTSFLGSFKKQIEFGEVAGGGKDFGSLADEEKREWQIAEYMEKNDRAGYKEAVLAVSKKHPELFRR